MGGSTGSRAGGEAVFSQGARRAWTLSPRTLLGVAVAALAVASSSTACAARGPVDPGAEDGRIGEEVRQIAAEVEGLEIDELGVEIRDGVVVLTGIQPSSEAVADLLEQVTRIRGVREVVNRIRVIRRPVGARPSPTPASPATAR